MIQDLFGSVRRHLVFRGSPDDDGDGGLVDKIGSCIRKSRVGIFSAGLSPPPLPPPPCPFSNPPIAKDITDGNSSTPSIRWRKGELIGCGAFGRVYMGMNLDSGEPPDHKDVLAAVLSSNIVNQQSDVSVLSRR